MNIISAGYSNNGDMKSLTIIEKIREKLKDSDPGKRTVTSVIQFNFTTTEGKILFGNTN